MSTYIGSIIGRFQQVINVNKTIGNLHDPSEDTTIDDIEIRNQHLLLKKIQYGNIAILVRNPFDRFVSSIVQVYINNGFGYFLIESVNQEGNWNDEFELNEDDIRYILKKTNTIEVLTNQEYTKLYNCLHQYFKKYLLKDLKAFLISDDSHLIPHHVPLLCFINNMINKGLPKEKITIYDVTEKNIWFESFLTDDDTILKQNSKPEGNVTPLQLKKLMKDILNDLLNNKNCDNWIPIMYFLNSEILAYNTIIDLFKNYSDTGQLKEEVEYKDGNPN